MSLNFGRGTGTLQRFVTGWAQTARQLQESPLPAPSYEGVDFPAKAYESGFILRLDPRLVDVAVSPVRLPTGFWQRAILREHAA
jgi:hypothetical protein